MAEAPLLYLGRPYLAAAAAAVAAVTAAAATAFATASTSVPSAKHYLALPASSQNCEPGPKKAGSDNPGSIKSSQDLPTPGD